MVSVGRIEGYRDNERAALAQGAFDGDRATMQLHQFLDQRQPDAASLEGAALRAFDPVKPLEQAR
jgi:hypothetical protein